MAVLMTMSRMQSQGCKPGSLRRQYSGCTAPCRPALRHVDFSGTTPVPGSVSLRREHTLARAGAGEAISTGGVTQTGSCVACMPSAVRAAVKSLWLTRASCTEPVLTLLLFTQSYHWSKDTIGAVLRDPVGIFVPLYSAHCARQTRA